MSTTVPRIPRELDDALYQALRAFYGDNRAVGATEAVVETLFRFGVVEGLPDVAVAGLWIPLIEDAPNA